MPALARRRAACRLLSKLSFLLFAISIIAPAAICLAAEPTAEEKLILWHQWTGEKRDILCSLLKSYNCQDNSVEVIENSPGPAGGAVAQALSLTSTSVERPHLALIERDSLPALAEKGIIFPVDDLLARSPSLRKENWLDSAKELVRHHEQLYGIPAALNPRLLIYNPSLAAKLGLQIPTRWNEFFELQDYLARLDSAPSEGWRALSARSVDSLFSILCVQNDIRYPKKQQEELEKILLFLKQLRERKVLPPHYKFWDPAFNDVTDGNVLFQIDDAAYLAAAKDSVDFPLSVAPMPSLSGQGESKTAFSDNQVFVLCRPDGQGAALDFLEFFFASPQYEELRKEFLFISPLKNSVRNLDLENENSFNLRISQFAASAESSGLEKASGRAYADIERVVARLDANLLSPEQALQEILKTCEEEETVERQPAASVSVSWAESTRRLFSHENASLKSLPVSVVCAGNEHEAFQLLVTGNQALKGIRWKVEPIRNAAGASYSLPVAVYAQKDAAITKPLVAARAGLYPNALDSIAVFDLAPDKPVRLWVDIFAPPNIAAGDYGLAITLTSAEQLLATIPVSLKILPFALPSSPSQPAVIGLNYDLIARHYNIERESEAGRKLMESFYWFLVERRLTPYQPPTPLHSPHLGEYVSDERVSACRIPFPPSEKTYDSIIELAKKGGWLEKMFVYFIDEPTYHQFPAVVETGERIHSRSRHPNFLVTCFPEEPLIGSVDIWCVHLSFLPVGIPHAPSDRREYLERVRRRQAAGEKAWWYTAGPVKPFPTLHIEDDPSTFRVIPWMQSLYGIDGFLHWEAANWVQPLDEPYIPFFGNGEGVLVYPGEEQPSSSIRLELLREGLEDMECLLLLRRRMENVQKNLSAEHLGDVASRRIRELCRRLVSRGALLEDPEGVLPLMFFLREPGLIERARLMVVDEVMQVMTRPHALVLTDPEEKRYTDAGRVRIYGVTEPGCSIQVGGRRVLADSAGAFSIEAPLETGTNTISVVIDKDVMRKIIIREIEKL
jgi:ABC-type glycerol-3-phosphate transport system substrate-binding protein